MTVAELTAHLAAFPPDMPVGILYDTQCGFYRAHEVKVSTEERQFTIRGTTNGTDYVCICDRR